MVPGVPRQQGGAESTARLAHTESRVMLAKTATPTLQGSFFIIYCSSTVVIAPRTAFPPSEMRSLRPPPLRRQGEEISPSESTARSRFSPSQLPVCSLRAISRLFEPIETCRIRRILLNEVQPSARLDSAAYQRPTIRVGSIVCGFQNPACITVWPGNLDAIACPQWSDAQLRS